MADRIYAGIAISAKWQDLKFKVEDQVHELYKHDQRYRVASAVRRAISYHQDGFGVKIEWEQIDHALQTQWLGHAYHTPAPLADIVQARLGHPNPPKPSRREYGWMPEDRMGDWCYLIITQLTGKKPEIRRTLDFADVEGMKTFFGSKIVEASYLNNFNPDEIAEISLTFHPIDRSAPPTIDSLTEYWAQISKAREVVEANKSKILW